MRASGVAQTGYGAAHMGSVPSVVYAAKSTEAKRGSIGAQIADCQAAIAAADVRVVSGEYRDEAASAYTGQGSLPRGDRSNRSERAVGCLQTVALRNSIG